MLVLEDRVAGVASVVEASLRRAVKGGQIDAARHLKQFVGCVRPLDSRRPLDHPIAQFQNHPASMIQNARVFNNPFLQ